MFRHREDVPVPEPRDLPEFNPPVPIIECARADCTAGNRRYTSEIIQEFVELLIFHCRSQQ